MNLIWFFLRTSWILVAIATFIGTMSGACSAVLMALVNNGISNHHSSPSQSITVFIGLLIMSALTSFLSQYLLVNLSQTAVYKLRLRLSNRILSCPLRHLEELGANRLLATLTEDIDSISDSVLFIPFLCIDIALIIGCLVYLGWLSLTVFMLNIILIAVSFAVMKFLLTKSERLLELAREEQDQLFKHFRAITEGIKELKLHAPRRQAFLDEQLQVTAAAWRHYNITSTTILSLSSSVSQILFFGTIGFLVFGLPQLTTINSTILSGYILVITYLIQPFQRILAILPGLSKASVALHKIDTLGLSLASRSETVSQLQFSPPPFTKSIELRDITHTYNPEHQDSIFTLSSIDLTFTPGDLVFIVGGNGSGKSTLAKLIAGLYVPNSGKILVDGKLITDENREEYRQLFSSVFSDFYLFDRFLGISLDLIHVQAQKYLQLLQLEKKVQVQEGRLSTLELSQGQRKRLALLTAYLEDRPIYLFDEWASDQDPYFREIFYKQLLPELKHRGKTVLAISHDERYFHLADRIIKLDYGKLVELNSNLASA